MQASASPLPKVQLLFGLDGWDNKVLVVIGQLFDQQGGCLWPYTLNSIVLLKGKQKGGYVAHCRWLVYVFLWGAYFLGLLLSGKIHLIVNVHCKLIYVTL